MWPSKAEFDKRDLDSIQVQRLYIFLSSPWHREFFFYFQSRSHSQILRIRVQSRSQVRLSGSSRSGSRLLSFDHKTWLWDDILLGNRIPRFFLLKSSFVIPEISVLRFFREIRKSHQKSLKVLFFRKIPNRKILSQIFREPSVIPFSYSGNETANNWR